MNFDDAIRAHAEWKVRIQKYLKNPDGSINVEDLGKDNLCALGQWIYGEGENYNTMEEYEDLREVHKHFHQTAAHILMRRNQGETIESELVLGAESDYAKYSTDIMKLLVKLKVKVHMQQMWASGDLKKSLKDTSCVQT